MGEFPAEDLYQLHSKEAPIGRGFNEFPPAWTRQDKPAPTAPNPGLSMWPLLYRLGIGYGVILALLLLGFVIAFLCAGCTANASGSRTSQRDSLVDDQLEDALRQYRSGLETETYFRQELYGFLRSKYSNDRALEEIYAPTQRIADKERDSRPLFYEARLKLGHAQYRRVVYDHLAKLREIYREVRQDTDRLLALLADNQRAHLQASGWGKLRAKQPDIVLPDAPLPTPPDHSLADAISAELVTAHRVAKELNFDILIEENILDNLGVKLRGAGTPMKPETVLTLDCAQRACATLISRVSDPVTRIDELIKSAWDRPHLADAYLTRIRSFLEALRTVKAALRKSNDELLALVPEKQRDALIAERR